MTKDRRKKLADFTRSMDGVLASVYFKVSRMSGPDKKKALELLEECSDYIRGIIDACETDGAKIEKRGPLFSLKD